MIVGNQKPVGELLVYIKSHGKGNVLIVGCDSCMNVALAGGEKEVIALVSELGKEGIDAHGEVLRRQCEPRFAHKLDGIAGDYDLMISLGCSIGAQTLGEAFPDMDVIPGVDTSNMGAPIGQGTYKEKCIGCGSCTIHRTGGICTLASCAKSLQNGPCGGSVNGRCEIDPSMDCAWCLVYDSLKRKGQLGNLLEPVPPKDWSKSHSGGVRMIRRGRGDVQGKARKGRIRRHGGDSASDNR